MNNLNASSRAVIDIKKSLILIRPGCCLCNKICKLQHCKTFLFLLYFVWCISGLYIDFPLQMEVSKLLIYQCTSCPQAVSSVTSTGMLLPTLSL